MNRKVETINGIHTQCPFSPHHLKKNGVKNFSENNKTLTVKNEKNTYCYLFYQKGETCMQEKFCQNSKICDYILLLSKMNQADNSDILVLAELKGSDKKKAFEQLHSTLENCFNGIQLKDIYCIVILSKNSHPRLESDYQRKLARKLNNSNNIIVKSQAYTFSI